MPTRLSRRLFQMSCFLAKKNHMLIMAVCGIFYTRDTAILADLVKGFIFWGGGESYKFVRINATTRLHNKH
jgi:hypothetical protein